MLLALLLLTSFDSVLPALAQDKQDPVELKDLKSSYVLTRPAAYTDRASWPLIVDLAGRQEAAVEPGAFVMAPTERLDEAFVLAALLDVKTKYRIHPERVIVRGRKAAFDLARAHPELFAGLVLQRPGAFTPPQTLPPCVIFLDMRSRDRLKVAAAAMVMKKAGIDVDVRESESRPGSVLEAIGSKLHPRGDLRKADDLQRAGRYLDASLLCIDLLDNPEVERLARTKLKSLEGLAIMELAKVEIAMADKKYKDAILRCREAARQFAWVPPGERLRKRLAELELRPEVKKALETED